MGASPANASPCDRQLDSASPNRPPPGVGPRRYEATELATGLPEISGADDTPSSVHAEKLPSENRLFSRERSSPQRSKHRCNVLNAAAPLVRIRQWCSSTNFVKGISRVKGHSERASKINGHAATRPDRHAGNDVWQRLRCAFRAASSSPERVDSLLGRKMSNRAGRIESTSRQAMFSLRLWKEGPSCLQPLATGRQARAMQWRWLRKRAIDPCVTLCALKREPVNLTLELQVSQCVGTMGRLAPKANGGCLSCERHQQAGELLRTLVWRIRTDRPLYFRHVANAVRARIFARCSGFAGRRLWKDP